MIIDPFSIALGLGPLAAYLLVLGALQCARRPTVTTGAQDVCALAIGISGLLMSGPLALFFPQRAYGVFGWIVWVMLAAFFVLTLLLVLLTMSPRLVIYGTDADQIREPLLRAAKRLDAGSHLEGQQVWCPKVGTAIRIETRTPTDTPQIVPQSTSMSPKFWRELTQALRQEVAPLENPTRSRGVALVCIGVLLLGLSAVVMATNPEAVVAGFRRWLRL